MGFVNDKETAAYGCCLLPVDDVHVYTCAYTNAYTGVDTGLNTTVYTGVDTGVGSGAPVVGSGTPVGLLYLCVDSTNG
jgi:hypothetical protein